MRFLLCDARCRTANLCWRTFLKYPRIWRKQLRKQCQIKTLNRLRKRMQKSERRGPNKHFDLATTLMYFCLLLAVFVPKIYTNSKMQSCQHALAHVTNTLEKSHTHTDKGTVHPHEKLNYSHILQGSAGFEKAGQGGYHGSRGPGQVLC